MEQNQELKINYDLQVFKSIKFWIFLVLLFVYTLFSQLDLGKTIDGKIYAMTAKNRSCPMTFESYQIGLFFPRIEVKNLNIQGKCLNQTKDLALPFVNIYFRGISFSPFGPHFKLDTDLLGKNIDIYSTLGFSGISFKIDNSTINLANIRKLAPNLNLVGNLSTNAFTTMGQKGIDSLVLDISTKDLTVPATSVPIPNMGDFNLPTLKIGNFLLQGQTTGKDKFEVSKLIIGEENASIKANFKGNIILNSRNIVRSRLNLKGEFALSDDLLKKLPILKPFLQRYTRKDKYYQVSITGTLQRPQMK